MFLNIPTILHLTYCWCQWWVLSQISIHNSAGMTCLNSGVFHEQTTSLLFNLVLSGWPRLWGLGSSTQLTFCCSSILHLTWRADSLGKTLMLAKTDGKRRRGWQWMRWLDGITHSIDMSFVSSGVGVGQEGLACCSPWSLRVGHDWMTELNC